MSARSFFLTPRPSTLPSLRSLPTFFLFSRRFEQSTVCCFHPIGAPHDPPDPPCRRRRRGARHPRCALPARGPLPARALEYAIPPRPRSLSIMSLSSCPVLSSLTRRPHAPRCLRPNRHTFGPATGKAGRPRRQTSAHFFTLPTTEHISSPLFSLSLLSPAAAAPRCKHEAAAPPLQCLSYPFLSRQKERKKEKRKKESVG